MKILVLASEDNCTAQMACGWLRWFDPQLIVYSAGVCKAGTLDPRAVGVMKAAGIDIENYACNTIEGFLSDNWDFVISVEGEELFSDIRFTGWIGTRLGFALPDPSRQSGPPELIDAEYQTACNEVRSQMFDFYLQHTLERDILGADSCGADCDL